MPGAVEHAVRFRPPYHLRHTLDCGQVFRWTMTAPLAATGILGGRVWSVRQEGPRLVASGRAQDANPLWWHLGVDQNLGRVEATLARDPILHTVLPSTSGIAIMRQDPWECLISFVISAFNNIPKIRLTIDLLSRKFGERLEEGGHAFPSPERLAGASPVALRSCVLGYRAPYVRAVARSVASGAVDLTAVSAMPYQDARGALLDLPGVGEKVAECILLFACGHSEAFPVDVWIHRVVEGVYRHGRRISARGAREWARDRFGSFAGYANQHLFLAARTGLLSPA